MCNTVVLNGDSGLIQSPNYPNKVSNTDCSIKYSSDVKKIFTIYALSVELESPLINQK